MTVPGTHRITLWMNRELKNRAVSWLLALLLLAGILNGELLSTASASSTPCGVSSINMYAWHHDADDVDWDFDGAWPDDEDWIAFINQGNASVDISGWRLYTDAIGHYHTFPPGTVLDPGEKIYVMSNYTGTVPDGWQDASQTSGEGWSDGSSAATWLVNPTSGQYAVYYTDDSQPGIPAGFPGTSQVCGYSMQGSGLGRSDLNECDVLILNTATGTYSIVNVCPGTDLDGDTVKDVADLCPNVSAPTKNGCLATASTLSPVTPPVCSNLAVYSGNDVGNFVRSWLSNGDGSFQTQPVTTSSLFRDNTGTEVFGTSASEFTSYVDVTGDGLADLVHVTENNSNSIYVYSNLGNGGFAVNPIATTGMQSATSNTFTGFSSSEQSWFADTNADGRLDYIFSGDDNRVHVYLGNGDGTFVTTRITSLLTSPMAYKTSGRAMNEYFMMADVSGDGVADLVGNGDSEGTSRLYVWRGNGDGTFEVNVHFNMLLQASNGSSQSGGVGTEEYSQLADADGDGDLDYVHASGQSGQTQILVFKNNGDGTFGPIGLDGRITGQSTTGFSVPNNSTNYFADLNNSERSFFEDLNGDGAADYIWTGTTPTLSGFFVWLNNGTGSFSTSYIHSNVSNRLTGDTGDITMGIGCVEGPDTDGDGIPDTQDLDDDNDGILDVKESNVSTSGTDQILVNGPNGALVQVTNPLGTPTLTSLTNTTFNGTARPFGDIAYAADGTLWGVDGGVLFRINTTTGVATLVYTNLPGSFNALSFGPDGKLYVGGVDAFRYDPVSNTHTLWYDYQSPITGSGGDFIFLNGKVYMSLVNNGTIRLYEGTLDDNVNITSLRELGTLHAGAWGLAADANGNLFSLADADGDNKSELERITFNSDGSITRTALPATEMPFANYALGMTGRFESQIFVTDVDTDGDGISNRLDLDSDNDGINDVREAGGTDANGDGKADGTVNSSGIPTSGGITPPNTDGDNVADPYDLDSDNDGISDLFENGNGGYDTNNDGFLSTADNSVTDTDGDGIMSVVDSSQSWGDANDNVPLDGDDADPTPHYIDTESDGDNILDIDEAGKGDLDANNDGRIDNSSDADLDGIADSVDNDDARFGGLPAPIIPLGNFAACTTDIVTPGTNGGTFGSGTAAFGPALSSAQTSYPYRAGTSLGGTYALIKNTDSVDYSPKVFNSLQDRTNPGNGYFVYFDMGIADRGSPMFTDTFTLTPNVQHQLSFWWAGPFIGTANSVGRLGIRINGVVVGALIITDNTGWQNYTFTFTSNSSGVTTVQLINNSTGGGIGSDVALDDFTVTTFCDSDGDGVPNVNDLDDDNDRITDNIENSFGLGDPDGDGIPSRLDLDSDNDGINDIIEAGGVDANGDGRADGSISGNGIPAPGAITLVFSDDDGLANAYELDSDNDGISDLVENGYGAFDTNNDGLLSTADSGVTDSDGDGIMSAVDGSPLWGDAGDPGILIDSDGDGIPNVRDLDSDGDGIFDNREAGRSAFDLDNNGIVDGDDEIDTDTDGDGIRDSIDSLLAAYGGLSRLSSDSDGDGVSDFLDLDSDGDGINDQIEGVTDTDSDGTPNYLDIDSDNDGISDQTEGVTDTDSDGTPNYLDIDSDNDGFTDQEENDFGSGTTDPDSVPGVVISAKVLLQGAILDPANPGTPLAVMRDDLRSHNFLPAVSPYNGGETVAVTTTTFADNGNDSVVDWLQLELRNAVTPTTIVTTLAVLVQRDGDVMDVAGSTTLVFRGVPVGSYFVAVTHRNHLGAMTAAPVSLSGTATLVDFTDTSADFFNDTVNLDGLEQATVDGKFALWTGDTDDDGRATLSGQNNDADIIFTAIDRAPGNLLGLPSFVLNGYFGTDVDLTGSTIFTGEDVNTLFNTVDGHPRNVFGLPTYVIVEQIP